MQSPSSTLASMIELKPCPFCGAIPHQPECFTADMTNGKWGRVECKMCGAMSGDVHTQYESVDVWAQDAAEEWNRRTPLGELGTEGRG